MEISLEGKKIIHWSCDCPYEGDICKHVVATVLAIRNNRSGQKRFLSAREAKLMEKQQATLKDKKADMGDIMNRQWIGIKWAVS